MRSQPARFGSLRGRRRVSAWPRRLLAVAALCLTALLIGFVETIGLFDRGSDSPARTASSGVEADGSIAVAAAKSAPQAGNKREGKAAGANSSAASRFALAPSSGALPVEHRFADPPKAGILFDVETGEVLWARHPQRELPIASLTKMMTAYLIARRHRPDERVPISGKAVKTGGSMVGVLPKGGKVPLGSLLKGLLLVSGNDAATALAEHDAGSVGRFVSRMNRTASQLGLRCTRYSSPHGLVDAGNHSCPADLAVLARADLANARIAAITRTNSEVVAVPGAPDDSVELFNNNPFIRAGDPTITGLKTGYTDAAGRCYVTTAERGGRQLGVVLLDSPDPLRQVPKLLELGAKA